MNTKDSIVILLCSFLTLFTLTDCNTCQMDVLEGDSFTFKLTDGKLKDDHRFTVRKDDKVKVPNRKKNENGPGIVKNDKFLEIQHANLNDSGTYTVEVTDVKGNKVTSHLETVCVYAKVPKPTLIITCQNNMVNFSCDVEGNKDLTFSWTKDGEEMMTVLNVLTNVEADKSEYTCTAQNPVHKNTSDPVEAVCPILAKYYGQYYSERKKMKIVLVVIAIVLSLLGYACRLCCANDDSEEQQQVADEEIYPNDMAYTSSLSQSVNP